MSSVAIALGSTGKLFTYADLEKLPESSAARYELSYGALIVTPRPSPLHQRATFKIAAFLEEIKLPSQTVLPDTELLLARDLVKVPDVQVVDENHVGKQSVVGTPALVVEILSPATRALDLTEKRLVYQEAGIQAYWIVDLEERSLTVLELDGSGEGSYQELPEDADGGIEISVPTTCIVRVQELLGRIPPAF